MAADRQAPNPRIYLLTVWQAAGEDQDAAIQWRFHLTDPHTGRRYGFTTPAELLAIVQRLST